MKNNIKDIWYNQELNSNTQTIRELILINNSIKCYVGRIGASNSRMFQIELNKSLDVHKNYLKRFHGVEIRILDSNINKKDITIILSDNDLLDIFILFIENLIADLKSVNDEKDILTIINQKVDYWSKLFAKIKGALLSKERQRGLYGELVVLESLLNLSSDLNKVIKTWTGPEGTNQDFSNEMTAIEVKSSKATKPSINISSELQLDWTTLDSLFLIVFHLDEIINGDNTLYNLIDNIKSNLSKHPKALNIFEDKLDKLGISIGEEKYYDDYSFITRSKIAFHVTKGFPVLINENINNTAIHNIKYQIDITACKDFEVEFDSAINKII